MKVLTLCILGGVQVVNECCVIGKVLNEPELDFLYQSKRSSVAYFWIVLSNNSKIRVIGYDDNADYIYQTVKKDEVLSIEGILRVSKNTLELEATEIEKVK